MSNSESREVDLIKDPGLPAHVHRRTDTDPVAAKRAGNFKRWQSAG